jgi:hypothetical protein
MKTILRAVSLVAASLLLTAPTRAEITGHWSFEAADLFLSARIGAPILEIDSETGINTTFGTTGSGAFAGVPNIAGQPVAIMGFPKTTPAGGYYVPHGAVANGGGIKVNRYTIILDVLFPAESSGKRRALFQTDGGGNAEFFVDASNRIGADGMGFAGNLTPDTWHRVAFAVDLVSEPKSIACFVDGVKVSEAAPADTLDGRFALIVPLATYSFLYFANDDDGETEAGYVNSIQVRDQREPDGVLSALGAPTPDGILTGALPDPYLVLVTPSPETLRVPERSIISPTPLIEAVIADGTNAVTDSSVVMQVNGATVAATQVRAGGNLTLSYTPSALLASGSTNTVRITFNGSDNSPYSFQWQFIVGRYRSLAADAATPLGTGISPGFTVRSAQASSTNNIANVKNLSRAIEQLNGTLMDLSGILVPNLAINGPNPNGTYSVNQINFHRDGTDFGVFPGDQLFPGIPGVEAGTDLFSTDVSGYLELTAGVHKLGISVSTSRTDSNDDDGYALYVALDPRNILTTPLATFDRGTVAAFSDSFTTNQFTLVAPVAGIYPFRLVFFQTGSDASLEFYSIHEATGDRILINDGVDARALRSYRVSTAPTSNKPHVVQVEPVPGGSGLSPTLPIRILVDDDQTQLNFASAQLFLNDVNVTSATSKTKVNGRTTILYQPNETRTNPTNNVRLVFQDTTAPTPLTFTYSWSFSTTVNTGGESLVTGQWDFQFGDLSATIGNPLQYFDGPTGLTATKTRFGTCSSLGVPLLNGEDVAIMNVPGDTGPGSRNIGYVMAHGIQPNGGGTRVNQYTLIFDVMISTAGPGAASMLQVTDPAVNLTDGDLFWQGNNFGQGANGYNGTGQFTPGVWHRVIAAYDEAANPPVVTKYVDGIKQDDWTANQGLDNDRRALLPTALLFADGDQDERREWWVSSIQIRDGKLTDAQMVALGGPSASKIPVSLPKTTVAGQWDFDRGNLSATAGKALRFFDGAGGVTETKTMFGTCSSMGVPLINGEDASIMYVPGDTGPGSRNIGYVMEHGIKPNGGGTRVNQYTIIFDVLIGSSGPGAASMLQVTDPDVNLTDGDLFWQGNNFGQGANGYNGTGQFTPGAWHRVIAAYDEAASPPVVTKFVDGIKQDDWTANQGLDNDRRAMLATALLFADGDQDERREWWVNSIQIREGKMTDAEMVALGGPSAQGIPVETPQTTVSGQWDFERANLSATAGKALRFFDGAGGATETKTMFGTCSSMGVPLINGVDANIMYVPGDTGPGSRNIGYVMEHGIKPNGGGTRVNQYTLIFDVLIGSSGPGAASMLQVTDPDVNLTDGDLFWQGNNFGQGANGYNGTSLFTPGAWHRVIAAYNESAIPPVVTKYVDGVFQDDWTANQGLDNNRRALLPTALLFADGDEDERREWWVNSIQIREGVLSKAEMEALGGPSASGIPVVVTLPTAPPAVTIRAVRTGTNLRLTWPTSATGYILQASPDLTTPDWQNVPNVTGNTAEVPLSGNYRFFRLIKP